MNIEQRIIASCPSFEVPYEELRKERRPTVLSLREILDELAGHVVQLVSEGSKDNLRSLFLLVEDVQTEIDNELKNAINTGFLESLQAETKLVGLDPELYIEFLGPHTKSWWNDLTKNWEASHDW